MIKKFFGVIMNSSDKYIKKVLLKYVLLSTIVFWGISSLVLSPLYVITASNVLHRSTNIPEIFEILIQVCDIAVYSVCFSAIVYSIYRFKLANSFSLVMTYCAAIFLRYTANIVMTLVLDGTISVSEDVVVSVVYFLLDASLLFLISFITSSIFKKFYIWATEKEKSNLILGIKNQSIRSYLFPFDKIYSRSNPLQRSALTIGIMLALVKIFSRILYDIYVGFPTTFTDGIWMVVYYVADVLICLVVYLISLLVFARLDKKENN